MESEFVARAFLARLDAGEFDSHLIQALGQLTHDDLEQVALLMAERLLNGRNEPKAEITEEPAWMTGGNHPSSLVPCPNCDAPIEHSLAWLKGRSQFEFYCHVCGHRDDIEITNVSGLSEALRNLTKT